MEVKFQKALFAWEKDEMVRLVNLLQLALTTSLYQEDRAAWKASSLGIFSTASMYNWLESANGPISKTSRLLWQNIAPPKVQFFGWGALERKGQDLCVPKANRHPQWKYQYLLWGVFLGLQIIFLF
ncbi:hypothetical protein ACSBR2_015510 [Camellia fascicularis]